MKEDFGDQKIMSKSEILTLHNKFKWCTDDKKHDLLLTNKFQIDLNFSEVLYSYLINGKMKDSLERIQTNDSVNHENIYDEIYDKPIPRPRSSQIEKVITYTKVFIFYIHNNRQRSTKPIFQCFTII